MAYDAHARFRCFKTELAAWKEHADALTGKEDAFSEWARRVLNVAMAAQKSGAWNEDGPEWAQKVDRLSNQIDGLIAIIEGAAEKRNSNDKK